MPYIPHTDEDVRAMQERIGIRDIDELFDEIPKELRIDSLPGVPGALTEMEVARLMAERAASDGRLLNFIGAGAYEHHIPAPVWAITTRGEFYSAYTPYQAEASQGTLQVMYEFQSMIAGLTAMDVSNASLYDGASALAEACLMAVRAHRRSKSARILVPSTVNPTWRRVARVITEGQGLMLEELPYCTEQGTTIPQSLARYAGQDITALVIQQPNFFGQLEDVDALTRWARANGAQVIAATNPVSLALLAPPGEWGEGGADIACGEAQPFGVPLSSGGPYVGFMATRMEHVRQMPGRIAGRTLDLDGKTGFTLTLQAREQHIRRGKATSNICTNQGLLMTAATIYLSLLGPVGLARVAAACVARTQELVNALTAQGGVRAAFPGPRFHEAVLLLGRPVAPVLESLAAEGIAGGYDLARDFPELGPALLVCATETRTSADIESYARALQRTFGRAAAA
ncbi:MAG TPA: aminomethyl-transferring glycine dehydrogenase subunit GcvPA [Steroidobacteraceae bacterium]|nr:aminomethyl-transferring glycine dehydrogenase subunit GcvPA [Steroidobacteraceae bacterium]